MRKWVVAKNFGLGTMNTSFDAKNRFTANLKAILITKSFNYILEEKTRFYK